MHDESHHTVRTIEWRNVFPFTRLFRSFRIAIHPAKLALALVAILLVYTVGRVVDGVWPGKYSAVVGEVTLYEQTNSRASFKEAVADQRAQFDRARATIVEGLRADRAAGRLDQDVSADPSFGEISDRLARRRELAVKAARDAYGTSAKDDAAAKARDAAIRAAYASAANEHKVAEAARGRGIFATFLDYEANQIDKVASGVVRFDWIGRDGVFSGLRGAIFTGPGWAFTRHPLHATIMAAVMLFAWSIFGGALARVAAVHVARDEKISVRQALRFSSHKLLSFFAAPIMPLLIVGAIALVLALVGLLTEIPYVGGVVGVILGAAFIVLIFVGVLLACALIGTLAGAALMYPTIAVEDSDAFDAVSRSFSYVFARPWKVLFYTLLSVAYAAVTYVALRLVVFLTLALLHGSLNAWTRPADAADGRTSFAHAWPGPASAFELVGPIDYFSLTFAEKATAGLLSFWLYLFVSLLGAYLLSFFISAGTIAYYLLRRDVDATPVDDVHIDPEDEEEADEFDDLTAGNPVPPPADVRSSRATARPAETTRPIFDSAASPPPAAGAAPVVVTMTPADASPPAGVTVTTMPVADVTQPTPTPAGDGKPHPVISGDGPEPSQNPT